MGRECVEARARGGAVLSNPASCLGPGVRLVRAWARACGCRALRRRRVIMVASPMAYLLIPRWSVVVLLGGDLSCCRDAVTVRCQSVLKREREERESGRMVTTGGADRQGGVGSNKR